jgi:hypothetical protein
MSLSKTTKLQAINTMLSSVGEPPVNSLTALRADSLIAQNILEEVMRDVQSYGWLFNTEDNVTLIPETGTGYIYIGDNVARVDMDPSFYNYDITIRGNRLYERKNNTYSFAEPIKVTRVLLMEYDEMPEVARRYIFIRASRIFQDRVVGSERLHAFTQADEIAALARMSEHENETGDYTIFQSPDVARTFMRQGSYRVY